MADKNKDSGGKGWGKAFFNKTSGLLIAGMVLGLMLAGKIGIAVHSDRNTQLFTLQDADLGIWGRKVGAGFTGRKCPIGAYPGDEYYCRWGGQRAVCKCDDGR